MADRRVYQEIVAPGSDSDSDSVDDANLCTDAVIQAANPVDPVDPDHDLEDASDVSSDEDDVPTDEDDPGSLLDFIVNDASDPEDEDGDEDGDGDEDE